MNASEAAARCPMCKSPVALTWALTRTPGVLHLFADHACEVAMQEHLRVSVPEIRAAQERLRKLSAKVAPTTSEGVD